MKKDLDCLQCTLPFCKPTSMHCTVIGPSRKQRKTQERFAAMVKDRSGIAALGMKKYDKRRKPDTPQRTLWRLYKK